MMPSLVANNATKPVLVMSQTAQLVDTLKKLLRERKITYADVASHLELSEANVKRMFSKRHFTLSRLEEVCALANADFPMTSGDQQRDWIYVGNVVDALLRAGR